MKKIIVFILLLFPIFATSQASNYEWMFRLEPQTAQLWVKDSLRLNLAALTKEKQGNVFLVAVTASGWSLGPTTTPNPPIWTVNGILNGNNEVGQILIHNENHIVYKAPLGFKPDKNPVEVKAAYKGINIYGRIFDTTIINNIEILGGWEVRLDPDSAWIRVHDTLPLTLIAEYTSKNNSGTDRNSVDRGIGWWLADFITPQAPEWTVNGIPNGNNLVGQIIRNGPKDITFKAPVHLPVKNPVEVIAAYKDFKLNNTYSDKKLTTQIWIVDSDTSSENNRGKNDSTEIKGNVGGDRFEVKMVSTLIGGSRESWGGVVTYSDEGSFRVSVEGENAVVTDIRNNLEVLTTNCAMIITNPTTNTGMLHVVAAKSIKVTPPNPPGQRYPIVEIWFVPHPTELTKFKFTCPPPPSAQKSSIGKIDLSQMAMLTMSRMPALPPYIKFIAKDEEQILIEKGSPGSEIYYKFSVRKVKGD